MYRYFLLFLFMPLASYGNTTMTGDLSQGFWHPVFNFAHILPIIAIGLMSIHTSSKGGLYKLLVVFLFGLLIGAIAAVSGINVPKIPNVTFDADITWGFCFLAGLLVLMRNQGSILLSMILVGIFSFFHAYIHGQNTPLSDDSLLYIFGFMLGTAALYSLGIFIGILCNLSRKAVHMRNLCGAAIAALGLYLLVQYHFDVSVVSYLGAIFY